MLKSKSVDIDGFKRSNIMDYKKYKKLCDEVYANVFSKFYPKYAHIDKTVMEEEFKETNDTEHITIKNESFLTWVAIINKTNLREIADILKKNNKNYAWFLNLFP